jgi:hypothetical protein
VNFEWIDQSSPEKGTRVGFIAQETEKVLPEVVNTEGEYYSMQYGPVSALLVEAMKEQQKIIESQKNKLENLEKNTQDQQARIEELEKAVSILLEEKK